MTQYTKLFKPCIGHKYKYIWYIVPKCGRTSLLHWLLEQHYIDVRGDGKQGIDTSKLKDQYFTFAFCRNPYDRLVSTYFNKVPKQKLSLYKRWKDKSFKQFANDVCDMSTRDMDGHLLPQIYFIPEYADFVGRFENLQNDYAFVTSKLFPTKFDNRRNNTSKHKHHSEYYDQSLKDKVYQKYKEDFERFEYVAE